MIEGLTVSVGYATELARTLPTWRKHCDRILVVTDYNDKDTERVAFDNGCSLFQTGAFYENGATFNKGTALELAKNHLIRDGWMIVFDADIVAPASIPWDTMMPGILYGAPRELDDGRVLIEREWPGYFWCFHGSDPNLKQEPWWTGWMHAGCYDSEFERRWNRSQKVKFPFKVRHLGPTGENWWGKGNIEAMQEMKRIRRERGGYQHERA